MTSVDDQDGTTTPSPGPAWAPTTAATTSPGDGVPWHTREVKRSLKRISDAPNLDAAQAQALTEQVILLHSIRRILIWTLVLVPVILTALGIILLVSGQAADPKDCGLYGTRC